MDEITTTQADDQNIQTAATEIQEQQTTESTPEKVSALQKFIDGLFGGGKKPEEAGSEKKEEPDDGSAAEEKSFTQADLEVVIEAEKKKWEDAAAEAERVKKLSPEQRAAEEQGQKDTEIASLRSQLLQKELHENATKSLEKDGFPVGLADILDYSSKDRMEESLKNTTAVFKESLAVAVQTRLKGRTPEGLGGAASSENLLRDQIARNIRGL